eukprot:33979_1
MFVLLYFICAMELAFSAYHLNYTYMGNTFFDDFDFDYYRQQNTFSNFQNKSSAYAMGIINTSTTTAYIGTDYTNIVGSEGRASVEMSSYQTWTEALWILNASHMPYGCGVWPAFWILGTNTQVNHCEIDVIEGINLWTNDQANLHTTGECDFSTQYNNINMTGYWRQYNCTMGYSSANGSGCETVPNMPNTYGKGFNDNRGGIYALELNYDIGIKIWFWSMYDKNIPNSIYTKKPDIDSFGIPFVFYPFGSWCESSNFKNMQVMFDLYYCGWSGQQSFWDEQCQKYTSNATCQDWVANNPSYFRDAYWLINYLDVYTM